MRSWLSWRDFIQPRFRCWSATSDNQASRLCFGWRTASELNRTHSLARSRRHAPKRVSNEPRQVPKAGERLGIWPRSPDLHRVHTMACLVQGAVGHGFWTNLVNGLYYHVLLV